MNATKKIKGFTIIEVVLVLAIAGLIFLMVFIALPALQASQRDSARKNDVGVVMAGVGNSLGSNRGALPDAAQLKNFVPNLSAQDPVANLTVVNPGKTGDKYSPADGVISVITGVTCGATDTSGVIAAAGTSKQYMVIVKLESGSGQYYCQNS